MPTQNVTAEEGGWEGSLQGHIHSLGVSGDRVLGEPGRSGQAGPSMSHLAGLASWNPCAQATRPQDAAMGARQRWERSRPREGVFSPGGCPQQSLQGQTPGAPSRGQEAKVTLERPQLSPEQRVLLERRGQPALQGLVVETPLLPGPLGCFVVLPPLLPVNRVLLLFWQELPLPTQGRAPAPRSLQDLAVTLERAWQAQETQIHGCWGTAEKASRQATGSVQSELQGEILGGSEGNTRKPEPGHILGALRQGTDHRSNFKDADQSPGADVHQRGGQRHMPGPWGQCTEGTSLALGDIAGVAGKPRDDWTRRQLGWKGKKTQNRIL